MSNEIEETLAKTHKEKVIEARRYLVDYLKTDRAIADLEKKLCEPFANPDNVNRWSKQLSGLEQKKTHIEIAFQKEFGIDLKQELGDGQQPSHVMYLVRNKFPEPNKQYKPTSPDKPKEPEKDKPTQTWTVNSSKVEEQRHGVQTKPELPSQVLTKHTLTVTHPNGEVPQGDYENLYRQQATHHHRPHKNRYKGREK